jgi:vancomycin permeability regulator SanA
MGRDFSKPGWHRIRRFLWLAGIAALIGPDLWVLARGSRLVRPVESISPPAILLVPGASVLRNGKPSPVLRQRVEMALFAARNWPGSRIVLSGSAVPGGYDEPLAMRRYLAEHGIDSARMLLDRGGVNTRSSVLNLGAPSGKLVIVSQGWHLARACWLAVQSGWDVQGLAAGEEAPAGWENLLREHLVRTANFWERIFRRSRSRVVSFPPNKR